jgi:competence ComEA-like helix-hairpin-helix protein
MIRYAFVAGGVALAAFAMLHPVPHPPEIAVASATVAPAWSASVPRHRRHARKRSRAHTRRRSRHARSRRRIAFSGIVDLNSASVEQLARVPGLGASIASRIVTLRQIEGDFSSITQLLDVAGMTDSRLDRAERYLRL